MQLTATPIDIGTNWPLVLLNNVDADELGAHPLDRVRVDGETGIVERTDELVEAGAIGVTEPLANLSAYAAGVYTNGGDPDVTVGALDPGPASTTVTADRAGIVSPIDNRGLCALARRAGAPLDAGAGLVVRRALGERVDDGVKLYTIHAETAAKLQQATAETDRTEPVQVWDRADTLVERR